MVVDNPPFSILSEICKWYTSKGIKFFLFGPALTLFSSAASSSCCAICCGVAVTYENKAQVSTSFLTNLEPEDLRCRTAPKLYKMVDTANKETQAEFHKEFPKYEYPDNVITSSKMSYLSKYGVEFKVKKVQSYRISELDAQKEEGKAIYGSGFLISEKAAADKIEAEKAVEKVVKETKVSKWGLSTRELQIIKTLQ